MKKLLLSLSEEHKYQPQLYPQLHLYTTIGIGFYAAKDWLDWTVLALENVLQCE